MREISGNWRKLRNEQLRDLYSAPNINREIELRKRGSGRNTARVGVGKCIPSSYGETYMERDYFKDLDVDRRITLKWIK